MKRYSIVILCALVGFTLFLQSCNKDSCTAEHTYIKYTPVFVDIENIHPEISTVGPRNLEKPGKIYYYNDYILINEIHKGIHIIDNRIPENPSPVAFIDIPGNVDMAVKSNTLYADCYFDLLAIDITNIESPTLLSRQNDVRDYNDNDNRILVYYETEQVTEIEECGNNRGGWGWGGAEVDVFFDPVLQSNNGGFIPNTGIGGSFARFTISGNYLYTVDESNLTVFDISDVATPTALNTTSIGWGIETIYPYGDNLFIGSNNGMFIFDNSDPANPVQVSRFAHLTACDPVVVSDNYAYVTLRSGTACDGFTNQLDLIDVSDIYNPRLEKSFSMKNPHGLSIVDNTLFVCEGDYGLKVFNASNPSNLDNNRIDYIKNFSTYDVIALPNDLLLVIGEDGFYQYDYTNPQNLKQVSKISVVK